jgi:small subunit ribosomal protein S21
LECAAKTLINIDLHGRGGGPSVARLWPAGVRDGRFGRESAWKTDFRRGSSENTCPKPRKTLHKPRTAPGVGGRKSCFTLFLDPGSAKGRRGKGDFIPKGDNKSVYVSVRDNNVDQALKALKKKMQREGLWREMKRRRSYEKPSERRVRKKAEAISRARKLERKRLQLEGF